MANNLDYKYTRFIKLYRLPLVLFLYLVDDFWYPRKEFFPRLLLTYKHIKLHLQGFKKGPLYVYSKDTSCIIRITGFEGSFLDSNYSIITRHKLIIHYDIVRCGDHYHEINTNLTYMPAIYLASYFRPLTNTEKLLYEMGE